MCLLLGQLRWREFADVLVDGEPHRAWPCADIDHGDRPERYEVHSWNQFGEEGRKKFPVPAERIGEQGAIARSRISSAGESFASDEQGKTAICSMSAAKASSIAV